MLDVVLLSADEVEELVGLHVDQDADELAEIPAKDGCQFFFRVEEVEQISEKLVWVLRLFFLFLLCF